MSITALKTHTCTIRRFTTPVTDPLRDPVPVETVVASNVPCRFDRGRGRVVSGVLRVPEVVGTLYIDADVAPDIQMKDIFTISEETSQFTIESMDRSYAMNTFHHWELALSVQQT